MGHIVFNMDSEWQFHRGEVALPKETPQTDTYASCKSGAGVGPSGKDWDDSAWETVDLPHDYLASAPFSPDNLLSHGYRTRENAWYRKSFVLDESYAGKQFFLVFEGVAVNAEFYVNGSLIERSFSAYTESMIDITDRVYFGCRTPNLIAVHINGMTTEGWWYEGAGIYRHVRLYVKEPLHIAHNGIYAKPILKAGSKNAWTVECETTLENIAYAPASGRVRVALYDGGTKIAENLSGEIAIASNGKAVVNQTFSVSNPTRWDCENPKLYRCVFTVEQDGKEIDEDAVRIGFRTIRYDVDHGFFLNEKHVVIKGTCNHQDHAGVGVAVPDSVQYYRIRRLKDMGCNGYRCSHNPPAKEILDACDEYGMLVMDENRRFECSSEALHNLEVLIRRDRNHPSIVFWSLFNEEPLQNSAEGAAIYRRMKSVVLKLDDTRLLTGAINGNMSGAGLEMDVTGINYRISSIEGLRYHNPERPIIGSENNSAVTTRGCYRSDYENAHVLSNYDEEVVPWGQTVRQTWDFVLKHEYFGGIFIWTGFDYRGEPTPFLWPSVSSQFGIMDTCGFPKDSFYYNQACFTDQPMVHLLPHWNWEKGETVRIAAPTNCDEVELFLNGESLGRKPSDCIHTPEWQVEFTPGRILAKAYCNGKCVAEDERRTAGKPYAVSIRPDSTVLINDGADTAVINVTVVDSCGVECPTASDHLFFRTQGGAFVRGVGNGDPNSHESDVLPERNLYYGWAQALISVRRGSKSASLTVEGAGLIPATIEFTVAGIPATAAKEMMSAVVPESRILTVTQTDTSPNKWDPLMVVAQNDNNTMLPIAFDEEHHQTDMRNGYRLYRSVFRVSEKEGIRNNAIYFPNAIADQLDLYVDGKRMYSGKEIGGTEKGGGQKLLVPIGKLDPHAEHELRVLVFIDNRERAGFRAGIHLTYAETSKKA